MSTKIHCSEETYNMLIDVLERELASNEDYLTWETRDVLVKQVEYDSHLLRKMLGEFRKNLIKNI